MKSKKFQTNFEKGQNLLTQTSELASQATIQCFFTLLGFFSGVCFDFSFCLDFAYAHMIRNIMNKKFSYIWLLCDTEALQLIIFQVEGFHEVTICSLQVVIGRFLLVEGGFRPFVSGRFLVVVGRFKSLRVLVSTFCRFDVCFFKLLTHCNQSCIQNPAKHLEWSVSLLAVNHIRKTIHLRCLTQF